MGGRVQIFLKIGNTDLFHRGNLKDCLIDKNINPPDISDISLPPSSMNLFSTYAVCWHDIKSGRASLNLVARAFDMILLSMLRREIGHQFFM